MARGIGWVVWASAVTLLLACGDDGGSAGAIDDDELDGSTGAVETSAECGNGIIEEGERCERINGVACDLGTCLPRPGYICEFVVPEGSVPGQDMFKAARCQELETADMCGNGQLDTGEVCDDFNVLDGDGCSAQCQFESGWDCTATAPTVCGQCGDGVTTFGLEECDPAGQDLPGCSLDCTVQAGWMCTQGALCAPICGDGLVLDEDDGVPDFYVEACDDGNAITGDGCTSTCQVESGWTCAGSPSECQRVSLCGDGIIEGREECDEGTDNSNSVSDACRTNCTEARCGDIVVDTDEDCDDGNLIDDDACNNQCGYTAEVDCTDGLDEDEDLATDCDDDDCVNDPACL